MSSQPPSPPELQSAEATADAAAAPQTAAPAYGIEDLLSALLRCGVYACVGLVGFGTLLSFINHPEYVSSGEELKQVLEAPAPRTMREILDSAAAARGRGFVMLGLLVMIATPVFRVGMAFLAFRQQRDRLFTLISAVVLVLLVISVALGKTHG